MHRHLSASPLRPARPSRSRRPGFTLVELLVVITIIAMLVGLLIPAIQAARAAARRTQCMNNQRNLGTAVINYTTTKEKFPPLFSWQPGTVAPNARAVGWVPPILPNIEQNELYRAFQNNQLSVQPSGQIETLLCPARNPDSSPAPLSYVVNGGAFDAVEGNRPMDYQENGVFFDEFSPKYGLGTPPRATPPIDLAYLSSHDGTKATIMLSENMDARDWAIVSTSPPPATGNKTPWFDPGVTQGGESYWNAILWEQPEPGLPGNSLWATTDAPTNTRLNKPSTAALPSDLSNARPYSNHSGGFFVTYCDGHTEFMSEEVQYRIYCLLMSPDSGAAKYSFIPTGSRNTASGIAVDFPNQWHVNLDPNLPLAPVTETDIP